MAKVDRGKRLRQVDASQLIKVFQCHATQLGLLLTGKVIIQLNDASDSPEVFFKLCVPRPVAQAILID